MAHYIDDDIRNSKYIWVISFNKLRISFGRMQYFRHVV